MGFGRDKSKDSGGFRGLIPDDTAVPVVCIECEGKLITIKNGDNAGRTARLYSCVFEVVKGKYEGGRIWHDIWCNVEPDPAGGDDEVFGSHMQFCDFSDIADVKDDNGDYITPVSEEEAVALGERFVGSSCIVAVGTRKFTRKDKSEGRSNSVKSFTSLNDEQLDAIKENVASVLEKVAKQQARRAVSNGASGFDDDDDDDGLF